MSDTIYRLLDYWMWFRRERPDGSIEDFLDYLLDEKIKGGGL